MARKAKAVEARAVTAVLARPWLCKITDDLYRGLISDTLAGLGLLRLCRVAWWFGTNTTARHYPGLFPFWKMLQIF